MACLMAARSSMRFEPRAKYSSRTASSLGERGGSGSVESMIVALLKVEFD